MHDSFKCPVARGIYLLNHKCWARHHLYNSIRAKNPSRERGFPRTKIPRQGQNCRPVTRRERRAILSRKTLHVAVPIDHFMHQKILTFKTQKVVNGDSDME